MKITQKKINANWDIKSKDRNEFKKTIWENHQEIKCFCIEHINSLDENTGVPEAMNLNAIINVFEMQKLKQESTKESNKFTADQSALDKILNELISEIKKKQINANNIINIINLQFYPAYRKLRLKEFLLQNHKRIAFEKDIFDSFSNKHISLMEGPFFWGIVENLHQGKKYWQYFMSKEAKEKLKLSEEQLKNLDVIHSAAKKSGSGIRLDHIIPRASLRTYFEKLCCKVNENNEDKINLINTKVDGIYPYLVGCLVTTKENNWLKKQINPKNHDEYEVKSPLDLYEKSREEPNYLTSAENLFKTYCEHNNLNKNNIEKQINILHFESNYWIKLDKTKDVQKIIENAKKSFFDPKTQSD
jgi:hypothetical protein